MLLILLFAAFLLLLVLMVLWPRYISALTSLACMIAAILIVIYLQENGLQSWYETSPAGTPPPRLPLQQR